MISQIYYRKYGTPDFIRSKTVDNPKFVFIKSSVIKKIGLQGFCPIHKTFENFKSKSRHSIICEKGEKINCIPFEFAENVPSVYVDSIERNKYAKLSFGKRIEEYTPFLMEIKRREWFYYHNLEKIKNNQIDANNISKDFICAKFDYDFDNFTIAYSFFKINTELYEQFQYNFECSGETEALKGIDNPDDIFKNFIMETKILFDIKNGKVLLKNGDNDFEDCDYNSFLNFINSNNFCKQPEKLVEKLLCDLCNMVNVFSGKVITYSYAKVDFDYFYRLTKFPYEPNLSLLQENTVESTFTKREKRKMKFERLNFDCYNIFCKSFKIKSYSKLRKLFELNPFILVEYKRIKECGFKDINVINNILDSPLSIMFRYDKKASEYFCKKSIKRRKEVPTFNSLKNGCNELYEYDFEDFLNMFYKYRRYIPRTLYDDILQNGISRFNHDALSVISQKAESKNVKFKYTLKEKSFEDDIDGYKFRLPKDSYELVNIGTTLHNCVASYKENVLNRSCLIVFVQKDNAPRICIEVRGNDIHQQRVDRNKDPEGEDAEVMSKWQLRHKLNFDGNSF